MAKLAKRITNVKAKEKRQRSWQKNQTAKAIRINEASQVEAFNRAHGYTGKQLDNAVRRYAKLHSMNYRTLKNEITEPHQVLDIASKMGLI